MERTAQASTTFAMAHGMGALMALTHAASSPLLVVGTAATSLFLLSSKEFRQV
jgi:alpha-beta hydrolase superfamily lysophospholipase